MGAKNVEVSDGEQGMGRIQVPNSSLARDQRLGFSSLELASGYNIAR